MYLLPVTVNTVGELKVSLLSLKIKEKEVKNNGKHVRQGKPPLSGREGACRRRNPGEDCLSEASSAAPDGGSSGRANKPDNSGGASWFVLLAERPSE